MNKFAEWIKNQDKKQRSVSIKLGISNSTLWSILHDKMPSLKVAYQIEKYTQGAVTLYDWFDYVEEEDKTIKKTKIKETPKARTK